MTTLLETIVVTNQGNTRGSNQISFTEVTQPIPSLRVSKPMNLNPIIKGKLSINQQKQNISTPSYLTKNKTVTLEVGTVQEPHQGLQGFRISGDQIIDVSKECNIEGYRTMGEPEYLIVGQDPKYADLKFKGPEQPAYLMSADKLNQEKMRFRSGYQGMGSENQTSDLDHIIKGFKETAKPIKNMGVFGSANGANCHNGWNRNSLYYADYLNSDGVGKRP